MIFFWGETPDGWGIPGIHGPAAGDELDGYVQSGVHLLRGQGENMLIDTGNWTLPEYNNGMGEFLVNLLDKEKNDLKYILITHFHYDHTGGARSRSSCRKSGSARFSRIGRPAERIPEQSRRSGARRCLPSAGAFIRGRNQIATQRNFSRDVRSA